MRDEEQIRANEARREAAERRRAERRRRAALFVLLVILALGAVFALGWYVTTVKTIKVIGLTSQTEDRIITRSGLYTGKNIFTYDLYKAKKNIESDPYIRCESISRSLPSTLLITVSERKEFAAVQSGASFCVIDREGVVLALGRSLESCEGLLPVYGLGSMGLKLGDRIDSDGGKLRPYTVMQLIEAIGDRLYMIAAIDISNSSNIRLVTSDGTTVFLGDSVNIPSKVERMFRAMAQVDPFKASTAIIYVNSTGTTDISYPTPEPTIAPETTREPDSADEP